jgi:dimethylglycine dehydrogenase
MDVGGAPCMVDRITYTGDLGYEIWMEPAYQRLVYEGDQGRQARSSASDFGMRALLSMRLEKNFPTWFRELRPIYGPLRAAMDRFVKLSKNDFIGRDAAAKEHTDGPKRMRVSFMVDALDADVMGMTNRSGPRSATPITARSKPPHGLRRAAL